MTKKSSIAAGFTLIELMVTLAIAAILLGIAVPAFDSIFRSNRADTQVSSVVTSLNLARSEAITRQANVVVDPLTAGSVWTGGWRIWVDANANGNFDGADTLLRSYPAFSGQAVLTSGAATNVTFQRNGSVAASVNYQYRIDADNCRLERDVTVSILGRVSTARSGCP